MKLFTAENEVSSKTAVSLDTPLVVIIGFGDCHLEYFIQDVDENVFDRVSDHVRVSAHSGKILSHNFCYCKKSTIFFADGCVFTIVLLQRHHKSCFFGFCRLK